MEVLPQIIQYSHIMGLGKIVAEKLFLKILTPPKTPAMNTYTYKV